MPPQLCCPTGQPLTQTPAAQNWPGAQAILHAPQLAGSAAVTVQVPPHDVAPAGQTHDPSLHTRSAEQAAPQVPQFSAALRTSTHPPLQGVSLVPQTVTQPPLLQTSPGAHALLHPPQ